MVLGSSILVLVSIGFGVFCGYRIWLFGRRHGKPSGDTPRSLDQLPSVSVCIPARNEMNALTSSLECVLASRYPKFEVIVLDDSSVDDTSILIKSFAHAGVRFVEGSPLREGWLGKNHALTELAREASGTYILFIDVDTHIEPTTIGRFVDEALSTESAMVSALPSRQDTLRASALLAPLRWFWAIVLNSTRRPLAASSAWMIKRQSLLQSKLFEAHKQTVQPEVSIASHFARRGEYSVIAQASESGVYFEKKWRSQINTNRRIMYPQLGGTLPGAIIGLMILVVAVLPVVSLMTQLVFQPDTFLLIVSIVGTFVWWSVFYTYYRRVRASAQLLTATLYPYMLLQEMIILVSSVYGYATHSITWKGRPIEIRATTAAK